jgi:hypothetical protein
MKFLFSCTSHLSRYLKANLPRLPIEPGQQAGVRRLVSTVTEIAFQCHYVTPIGHNCGPQFLLAIEADSRYCLILPLAQRQTQAELSEKLQALFLTHVGYQLSLSNILETSDLHGLDQLFLSMTPTTEWVKNTDRSLQGTLTQLEFWLQDALQQAGKHGLSDEQIFVLSLQFNDTEGSRTVQGKKERFVPTPRFVANAMLRFGPLFLQQRLPDNVIDFAAYKAMKR